MKVNIDKTIEVSEDQRTQLANVLDDKVSKRRATRDEFKEFIWGRGDRWAGDLATQYGELTGEVQEPTDDGQPELPAATDDSETEDGMDLI